MRTKLTQSRLASLRMCPRQHYYGYELGMRRTRDNDALRFGSAYHRGLELITKSGDPTEATSQYAVAPQWADPFEWAVEGEKLRCLLAGHQWRYSEDNIEHVAAEVAWTMPLVNPDTGRQSVNYCLAGKIDGIVKLPDGRLAIIEYKTTSEDIADDAEYWQRLRADAQISIYMLAARHIGHNVQTILYDVTRKPSISPRQITLLDETGAKIVIDDSDGSRVLNKNGSPRQSAGEGMTLQCRQETDEEFGQRLMADIGERPDFYFARREIPRLEADLDECRYELWQQSQALNETRRAGRWFRNVSRTTCANCQFAPLCMNNVQVDAGNPPKGYEIVADVNPELAE